MSETGVEQEFEGVYVAHWEVARFVIQRGRGLFGRPKIQKWLAWFPPDFRFPQPDAHDRHGPGRAYRMRVRGRVGPRGHFGHQGMCVRELHISEVLECVETSSPGRTW
jgi:hypothetical protein